MIQLKARIRLWQRERRKRKERYAYARRVRREYNEGWKRRGRIEKITIDLL